MNEYVLFDDLRRELGIDTDETGDDELLREKCAAASALWESWTNRLFYPRSATRYYDYKDSDEWLKLDDDLLEVTTFTTENGGMTVLPADYVLKCGAIYGMTPYDRIVMKPDGDTPLLLFTGSYLQAHAVTGIWGYHDDWSRAWLDSGDTVQDATGMDASQTTITVASADGRDAYGFGRRFKVQQLLKVESEYLYLTAKNGNVLTVVRGVNGTTAATHAKAKAIYTYRPMADVERACRRLAAWLYRQKDNSIDVGQVMVAPNGVTVIPSGFPKDVIGMVKRYAR